MIDPRKIRVPSTVVRDVDGQEFRVTDLFSDADHCIESVELDGRARVPVDLLERDFSFKEATVSEQVAQAVQSPIASGPSHGPRRSFVLDEDDAVELARFLHQAWKTDPDMMLKKVQDIFLELTDFSRKILLARRNGR